MGRGGTRYNCGQQLLTPSQFLSFVDFHDCGKVNYKQTMNDCAVILYNMLYDNALNIGLSYHTLKAVDTQNNYKHKTPLGNE